MIVGRQQGAPPFPCFPQEASAWQTRRIGDTPVQSAKGALQMVEYHQSRKSLQDEVLSVVEWPIGESTGVVFDLDWLDRGTKKLVSVKEQALIDGALAVADPEALLYAPGVQPYVRTEYNRQLKLHSWGTHFLHQPMNVLEAGLVRSAFYLEWGDHIEQMKREGYLEEALALVYEVIDAAERVDRVEGSGMGAAGWYSRACIILRKLKDPESEVRLIERVLKDYPRMKSLADRLPTARKLAAKEAKKYGS